MLIKTFMHLFVIIFFSLLKTTQYLAIYCNILQYAIYRYSLLAISYCIAVVVNIAIYRYIGIPYMAKLSSGKTFTVRAQNFYSQENFHGSMLVDLHYQSTRP